MKILSGLKMKIINSSLITLKHIKHAHFMLSYKERLLDSTKFVYDVLQSTEL